MDGSKETTSLMKKQDRKEEKKGGDVTLQMALFLLMVVMSSLEPIISKWAVPEADAKKPFHLRPNKVSIEVWNYLLVLLCSGLLIQLTLGKEELKKCLAWEDGMKHFVVVEAFHGSSRVTKLFALAAGASSSLMKVITQGKLLVTALLNTSVGRLVTLTQWMLIGAVTVSVFGFIQCSAEVDAARKAVVLAEDGSGHAFWSGFVPLAWIPKEAGHAAGFLATNFTVLLCTFSVLLSTLSLFTGDLAFKKNKMHFLVQMVQARIIGFTVVLAIGVWSFWTEYSKTFSPNGRWIDEFGVAQSGNMAEAYGYADMDKVRLFFELVFGFRNWTLNMVVNVLFQVALAYTITYVLKSLDALWKGMGSSLSVAGTFVIEMVVLPLFYANGAGAFDSLVKKDPLFTTQLRTWSSTELAVVLSIVFTVSAYGITKMELKQYEADKVKAVEQARAEWEAQRSATA
jgi:hypothetical protein